MLGRANGFVFEDLAHGEEHDPGQALCIKPNIHIHRVIQIINVTISNHTKASSLDQEIACGYHAMINGEIRAGFPG